MSHTSPTASEVLAIIDSDLSEAEIAPFLSAATLLIEEVLHDAGVSADLLKEIERWTAAHFVAVRDPRITSESFGRTNASYEGGTGVLAKGLNKTRYGAAAIALDPTGTLGRLAQTVFEIKSL